mmetsp:Transcript_20619/g.58649  ORF Transcript_20619/g.58649 Transcript_20619/m.58649 type:complete len:80 (-) Transcript_20619:63-302(-)
MHHHGGVDDVASHQITSHGKHLSASMIISTASSHITHTRIISCHTKSHTYTHTSCSWFFSSALGNGNLSSLVLVPSRWR